MNALNLSACWREASETEFHYVRSGKTLGLVKKSGDVFVAEVDRRGDQRFLHLDRFPSKLAAMATVQDALIGSSSDAAALGREAIAAGDVREPDDEHHLVAFDVLNNVGTWR